MSTKKFMLLLIVILTSVTLGFASSLTDVQRQIAEKTKVEGLQVREGNGSVVLEGLASTLWDKAQAEKITSKELKTPVVNHIAIRSTEKSDRELVLDVSANIRSESANSYYLFNLLSVDAREGKVFLQGKLRDAHLKDVAVKAAMKTSGVSAVIDRIELLPVSIGDDRLRVVIYDRFRRDALLSSYFLGAQPSINIIVENARVTLAGSVNSNAEKMRAETIVRETLGVLSVNNQLDVG
jgi:osmotically-inducible protein OsmY